MPDVIDLCLDDDEDVEQHSKPNLSSHKANTHSPSNDKSNANHSPLHSSPGLSFEANAKVQQMLVDLKEARDQVHIQHEALTRATTKVKILEANHAMFVKFLRRKADASFNWLNKFPWDTAVTQQLLDVFKISSLRPLQREALNATLLRRDVFAILPTGAGKSLIYQLAAVVEGGLTLVVTPLISLSSDQRAALQRLNIRAESLDSMASKETVKSIYSDVLPKGGLVSGSSQPRKRHRNNFQPSRWICDDMKAAILFVTPEQIVRSKRFMSRLEMMYEAGHLTRICVDEAHCCSTWGHDFRADYRKLGILRRQCPSTPILALSATCEQVTTDNVCELLETRDCVVFRGSVDRPNLFYEVRQKKDAEDNVVADIASMVRAEFSGQCGIVYVLSKKESESYAMKLCHYGISAGCYHGDMDYGARSTVHTEWSEGCLQVVVATIAFGLGIDNQHVRFVIHATMATSLEGYYQESGRAGRDGKAAKCIVLHRVKEFARLSGFVADKGERRLQKMYNMYKYACGRGVGKKSACRRAIIAEAFGECPPADRDMRTCCDLCAMRAGAELSSEGLMMVDVGVLARSAARMMSRFCKEFPDEKITLHNVADSWSKKGAKGVRMRGEEEAIDKRIGVDVRLEILVELIFRGVLQEYHRHSSFSVNAYVTSGVDIGFAFGEEEVELSFRKETALGLDGINGCRILGPVVGNYVKNERDGKGADMRICEEDINEKREEMIEIRNEICSSMKEELDLGGLADEIVEEDDPNVKKQLKAKVNTRTSKLVVASKDSSRNIMEEESFEHRKRRCLKRRD